MSRTSKPETTPVAEAPPHHQPGSSFALSRRAVLFAGATGGALVAGSRAAVAKPNTGQPRLPLGRPGRDYLPVTVPNGGKLPWKIVDGVKVFQMVAEEVAPFATDVEAAKEVAIGDQVHEDVLEDVKQVV